MKYVLLFIAFQFIWFPDIAISPNAPCYFSDTSKSNQDSTLKEVSSQDLQWLKSLVIPLKSDSDQDKSDLICLKQLVSNVKIVGLGEETHGSGSIYRMKDRIVEYLIENEGFNVFALETEMPAASKLNNFINNGKGDPKQLLKDMGYWMWDTREMLDLLLWMRRYNETHVKKVLFAGIDMIDCEEPIGEITQLCNQHAKNDTLNIVKKLVADIKVYSTYLKNKTPRTASDSAKYYSKEFQKNINADCASLREYANKKISNKHYDWFIQNIRIIEQYTQIFSPGHSWYDRDKYMAENLFWLQSQNPNSKIIVWAHNGHVKMEFNSMGMFLHNEIKQSYLAIAFAFYEGTYSAFGKNGHDIYRAQTAYPGTYEYYFHCVGYPYFLLDLHTISKELPQNQWMYSERLKLRYTGAVAEDPEFFQWSIFTFNAVVFIDKATNSTLLHKW